MEIGELKEENSRIRKNARQLIAELRIVCKELSDYPAVYNALSASLKNFCGELEENRRRIAELKDDPHNL